MSEKTITAKEYAQRLKVSPGHVYNMLSLYVRKGSTGGLLVRPIPVGSGGKRRCWRFSESALDKKILEGGDA